MWATILSTLLNKNGSPAWSNIGGLLNLAQWAKAGNSAKNVKKGTNTFDDAVTDDGMYGSYGG